MKTFLIGKTGPLALLGLLIMATIASAAKMELYPSATLNYKMTVTVDTPEGEKTGSSIREVHLYIAPSPSISGAPKSAPAGYASVKGEAVVVDLGKHGKLFALLRGGISGSDYAYTILFKSFPWHGGVNYGGALTASGIKWYSKLTEGKKTLEPYDYPDMVMFKNTDNPKTVQRVFHGERDYKNAHVFEDKITDNTEKLFGEGVHIKAVSIEITNDPLVRKIDKYLPWLNNSEHVTGYLGSLPSQPFIDPSKTYLNGSEFSTGRRE